MYRRLDRRWIERVRVRVDACGAAPRRAAADRALIHPRQRSETTRFGTRTAFWDVHYEDRAVSGGR